MNDLTRFLIVLLAIVAMLCGTAIYVQAQEPTVEQLQTRLNQVNSIAIQLNAQKQLLVAQFTDAVDRYVDDKREIQTELDKAVEQIQKLQKQIKAAQAEEPKTE